MGKAATDSILVTKDQSSEKLSEEGKKTLLAAFFGFTVDMIDVYLPIIALAPAMVYFQPADLSPTVATTLYFLVFVLSLIGRPIGSMIFGYYGDKIGRRKTTLVSILGIAVSTLLIALLPGYAAWGLGGIITMAILRLFAGIFMGGEYTSANPLAMEYAPKQKRGLFGGFINAGFPAGTIIVSVVTLATLKLFPAGDATSAYAVWGWRIPFIIGAMLSFALFIYSYYKVPESEVWKESKKADNPLKDLFSKANLAQLGQVFLVMSGVWFATNAIISSLPGMLKMLKVDSTLSTNAQLITNIVMFFLFIFAGAISQKIGRKAVLILFGILGFTVSPILYYYLLSSGYQSAGSLILLVLLVNSLVIPVFGVLTSYITERFHTGVRASGYGVGYSLALIIPALTPFIMLGLQRFMPYVYTPIVILVIGGLFITIGALIGPETKEVDL
ncbi:MFS transporter [Brevibacillus centrosporus]|uniref:Major Facilitator Superfamily protein n=1 Tax=Brevibacillus centrosporus TaxID=54910 RepID=A0A1I3X2C6_9BACL|nr:MFS transporter [Brevibacillus centrosporus]SFK13459.1 Major Facilitator Superfamily protein [Brevibacillus centrosporus]